LISKNVSIAEINASKTGKKIEIPGKLKGS